MYAFRIKDVKNMQGCLHKWLITYFRYLSFNYFLSEIDKLSVHYQNFSGDMNFWNLLNIVFTSQQCAGNNMITFFEIKKLHFKWTIKWTSVLFIRNYKKIMPYFFALLFGHFYAWSMLTTLITDYIESKKKRPGCPLLFSMEPAILLTDFNLYIDKA